MDDTTGARITKTRQLKHLNKGRLSNQRKCLIIALAMAGTTTMLFAVEAAWLGRLFIHLKRVTTVYYLQMQSKAKENLNKYECYITLFICLIIFNYLFTVFYLFIDFIYIFICYIICIFIYVFIYLLIYLYNYLFLFTF